jgi:1,2-phenylacetyl-CoA epoxidase PaaB subunit
MILFTFSLLFSLHSAPRRERRLAAASENFVRRSAPTNRHSSWHFAKPSNF